MEKEKKPKLKRLLTVANVRNAKTNKLALTDAFYQFLGTPQDRGFWFLYGTSGSGKSSLAMLIAKELARKYKTVYNLHEERFDDTDFQDRQERLMMQDVEDNYFVQEYDLDESNRYLAKRNSAHVMIIDSTKYVFKNFLEFLEFKRRWEKKKLIIIIGHAEGTNPRNELQKQIRDDCKMKIFTSGYLGVNQGRTFGPKNTFIIWQEGYNNLNGVDAHKEN
jgi:adenosyl cobinamide kinase/adenosyl cobinamide phosphate guanylyltransferase